MQPLICYLLSLYLSGAVYNHRMRCIINVVWHGAGAEAGEHVLQQQQQLATLARHQRKHPPSKPDHIALPRAPATKVTNNHTDLSADKPKSADTAIDSAAHQAVNEVTSCFYPLMVHCLIFV